MLRITGKQSKAARSLLKWNIYDLANRVKSIPPKRIDSFEHGFVHIMEWENDEFVKAFRKAGILFKADMEVALASRQGDSPETGAGGQLEGAHIVLDAEQNVLADSSMENRELTDGADGGSEPSPRDKDNQGKILTNKAKI